MPGEPAASHAETTTVMGEEGSVQLIRGTASQGLVNK